MAVHSGKYDGGRQVPAILDGPHGSRPAAVGFSAQDAVAEVTRAFHGYEKALMANDLDALDTYFHNSPETRRFGVSDEQRGASAVRTWRRTGAGVPPGRRLEATQVLALSAEVAVVTTRFGYGAAAATGRQTQVWTRTPVGWLIVSAHVSLPWEPPAAP